MDLRNLMHGEGEWKNMQDIIRLTFKSVFEKIGHQEQEILKMNDVLKENKLSILRKVDNEEINKIVDKKIKHNLKHMNTDDIDELKSDFSSMKLALERKANIQYVDESLRNKANKSDNMINKLSLVGSNKLMDEINNLKLGIMETGIKNEAINKRLDDLKIDSFLNIYSDLNSAKYEIKQLKDENSSFCTKDQFKIFLDKKVIFYIFKLQ
jgi:hypothetical protein